MKKILFVVLMFVSNLTNADTASTVGERMVLLNAVAGNAVAGSLTFTLPLGGGSTLSKYSRQMAVLYFNYNYTATTSNVAMTCSSSDDGGTTLFVLQSCNVASGVCTSSDASWSKAISADKKWVWRVDFTSMIYGSCVVTITGGAANESITVTGYMTTK